MKIHKVTDKKEVNTQNLNVNMLHKNLTYLQSIVVNNKVYILK